jgi:uncharacterized membrane-anchored protein
MEVILIWLILSIVAGAYAQSKNRSGFGWFLLSILLSPIIILIILAILSNRTTPPKSLEARLEEIAALRDKGMITQDEYELKRKAIIESNS